VIHVGRLQVDVPRSLGYYGAIGRAWVLTPFVTVHFAASGSACETAKLWPRGLS